MDRLTASRHRHLVPLAAAQVTGLVCGVVGVRWSSAVIPPDLMGLYGLLLSATQAALVVTHQGFTKHIQRTWTAQQPAKPVLAQLLRTMRQPTAWLAIGMIAVLAVLHYSGGVPANPGTYAWLLAANLGIALTVILQNALQAEERFWASYVVSAVTSITRSFGPPLLVMLLGASLAVVSSAFLLHAVATAACGLWLLRSAWTRPGPGTESPDAEIHGVVQAFAWTGLCGWLIVASARWIAALILDADHTGYFVLAGNLTLIVPATVVGIFLSHSFPVLFSRARDGAGAGELKAMTNRTILVVMLSGQAGIALLAWAAPWLVGTVIAVRYTPALEWLLATGGVALAAAPGQFYQNLLLASGRQGACVPLSVISFALRAAIMGAGAWLGTHAFQISLVAMPWLTLAVEGVCVSFLLRRTAQPA